MAGLIKTSAAKGVYKNAIDASGRPGSGVNFPGKVDNQTKITEYSETTFTVPKSAGDVEGILVCYPFPGGPDDPTFKSGILVMTAITEGETSDTLTIKAYSRPNSVISGENVLRADLIPAYDFIIKGTAFNTAE